MLVGVWNGGDEAEAEDAAEREVTGECAICIGEADGICRDLRGSAYDLGAGQCRAAGHVVDDVVGKFHVVLLVWFWLTLPLFSRERRNFSHISHMNQEKNRTFSHFSHRTEILADKLNVQLQELGRVLGVSNRMLFGYRSGSYPISDKAWRKLEAAEKAAGIGHERPQSAVFDAPSESDRLRALEHQVSQLIAAVKEQTEQMQKLIDQRAASSPDRGRAVASKKKKLA